MNFFRYDYNYKLIIVSNLPSIVFCILAITSYHKDRFALWFFGIAMLISLLNSFVFINNQGIRIQKSKVIIVDGLFFRSINLSEIKCVKLKEIKKEKRSNLYGFKHEFYHYSTYMNNCDFVYNNGKVFEIIFYLKDNSTRESYFGWMYREKNESKVNKIQTKLTAFVNHINQVCKERG